MQEATDGQLLPKHFDGTRFYNPNAPQARGWRDVIRWKLSSRAEPCPSFIDDVEPSIPPHAIYGPELRVTFVNHSTVLLQQNGCNVLTDPVWSRRASPLQWIGPRRHRRPGIRKEDLPPIDIVLLSHNHYDHLDLSTLRWLARRRAPAFVAPSGVSPLLRAHRIEPVVELGWGERRTLRQVPIHAVPALHFSGRGFFDRNKTLWCGYVVESAGGPIYFAGDTGFGNHFAQIRDAFGSPRLALLPIGAYRPRWFMSSVHMEPAEAVEAHRILGSAASIAIHHGTFQLGDDAVDTAVRTLLQHGLPDSFHVLRNGEFTCIV
ncbi:MAG: MBL fold metallo-hydrolase [Acidobacteriaceae bacterium]|nr:MBL fold metallo-hydrolase [Acidobacteriaceae bacterium]